LTCSGSLGLYFLLMLLHYDGHFPRDNALKLAKLLFIIANSTLCNLKFLLRLINLANEVILLLYQVFLTYCESLLLVTKEHFFLFVVENWAWHFTDSFLAHDGLRLVYSWRSLLLDGALPQCDLLLLSRDKVVKVLLMNLVSTCLLPLLQLSHSLLKDVDLHLYADDLRLELRRGVNFEKRLLLLFIVTFQLANPESQSFVNLLYLKCFVY